MSRVRASSLANKKAPPMGGAFLLLFIIRDFDIKERKFDILVGRFLNGITIHNTELNC